MPMLLRRAHGVAAHRRCAAERVAIDIAECVDVA
jgi:hypothetical protein